MEIVSKMRKSMTSKTKPEAKKKLNIYMLSHIFTQLVNFQQLIKSIGEFVGKGQLIKSDILLDSIKLAIDSIVQSMLYDRFDLDSQLKRISEDLEELNIRCSEIKIKSLYPRLIKLDLVVNSPPKDLTILSIQGALESILNEPLRLIVEKTKGRQTRIKVYSSSVFKIEHAVSSVGKDGAKISGDNYIYEAYSNGQTLIALSDGMGNGEVAYKESSEALSILKCLLSFNIPMKTAIQTLQKLKQHSNADERFFSLDICLIDRERQRATFYKQGATPTYLVRDNQIEIINLAQLPVGVVVDQDVEKVTIALEENDLIIMCSDGITDQYLNMDDFEKNILGLVGKQPKLITKNMLQTTINKGRGKIKDDMLILAIEYKRQTIDQMKIA